MYSNESAARLSVSRFEERNLQTHDDSERELTDSEHSLLHVAAGVGDMDSLLKLLKTNKDLECSTTDGCRPMHLAAKNGHLNAVKFFVANGADVESITNDGWKPIHLAARYGHCDVVRFLMELEVDVNSTINEGLQPIHLASVHGHTNVVRLLMKGRNAIYQNNDKNTCISYGMTKGHLDVVENLINEGMDPSYRDNNGLELIHQAAINGHLNIVKLLLQKGAKVSCIDKNGWTPTHFAAAHGHLDVVELLIEHGASIECQSKDKSRPIHLAAENNHAEIVKLLIDSGANIECRNIKYEKPVQVACQKGSSEALKCLLSAGCLIDAADGRSKLPITYALENGNSDCYDILKNEEEIRKDVDIFHFEEFSLFLVKQEYRYYHFVMRSVGNLIMPLKCLMIATGCKHSMFDEETLLRSNLALFKIESDQFSFPEYVVVNKDQTVHKLLTILQNCRQWNVKLFFPNEEHLEIHENQLINDLIECKISRLRLYYSLRIVNFFTRHIWIRKFVPLSFNVNPHHFKSICMFVKPNSLFADIKELFVKFQKLAKFNAIQKMTMNTSENDSEIILQLKLLLQIRSEMMGFCTKNKEELDNSEIAKDQYHLQNGSIQTNFHPSDKAEFIPAFSNDFFQETMADIFQNTLLISSVTEHYQSFIVRRNQFDKLKDLTTFMQKYMNNNSRIFVMSKSNIIDSSENVDSLQETIYFLPISNLPSNFQRRVQTEGAFSYIHICPWQNSSKLFAVKEMNIACSYFKGNLELFKKSILSEIMVCVRAGSHPHIMKYLDFYESEKSFFIVMDRMEESLQHYLKRIGPLQETKIIFFSKQILCGLQFLHAKKIIHRDIKGGNILLDENEILKLTDFGVSKILSNHDGNSSTSEIYTDIGTHNWTAPEVLNNSKYGRKADIWSFGATLVEMITGKAPYHGLPSTKVILKIANEMKIGFDRPKYLSNDLYRLTDRCLHANPQKRPSCDEILKWTLFLK